MIRHYRSVLLLVLAAATAGAQRIEIAGRVLDGNRKPVPHANVVVSQAGRYVADDTGAFLVRVRPGSTTIDVRRLGYQPARANVTVARDTTIEITMLQVPQELPAQSVVTSAMDGLSTRGFYSRMRDADRGITYGYFVTPEDIEARRPFRASQLLERVPGVRLLGMGGNSVIPVGMNDCAMTVYLDGARLAIQEETAHGRPQTGRGSTGMRMDALRQANLSRQAKITGGNTFDGIIGVTSIAGIEIYPRGTRAPAMFQLLNGTCGIIAVWTR